MIDVVVIVISGFMVAFFLVWWRWPAFRLPTEAPKYFVLQQERRFEEGVSRPSPGTDSSKVIERGNRRNGMMNAKQQAGHMTELYAKSASMLIADGPEQELHSGASPKRVKDGIPIQDSQKFGL